MRCSHIAAGLFILLAPLVSAGSSKSSGTTTSTSTTTITRTVVRATQTSTMGGSAPSATATQHTVSVANGIMGAKGTGIVQPTSAGSAPNSESSLRPYSYLGAASIERGNWNVAVMAGSVALVLGYTL